MQTEIVVILDRSGSMASVREDMEEGLRQFILEQKRVDGDANFSLIQFDNEIETVIDGRDIKTVDPQDICLLPRGSTALLDAIGRGITHTQDRINSHIDKPEHVIVVVITDGHENASREFKKNQIEDLIKKNEDWHFTFLGADMSGISDAHSVGFQQASTMNYAKGAKAVNSAYVAMSRNISDVRIGLSSTISYSDEDRISAMAPDDVKDKEPTTESKTTP